VSAGEVEIEITPALAPDRAPVVGGAVRYWLVLADKPTSMGL
jgi:hypothetical protein